MSQKLGTSKEKEFYTSIAASSSSGMVLGGLKVKLGEEVRTV